MSTPVAEAPAITTADVVAVATDLIDAHTNNHLLPAVEKLVADAAPYAPDEISHFYESAPAAERAYIRDGVLAAGVLIVILSLVMVWAGNAAAKGTLEASFAFGLGLIGLAAKLA